MKIGIGLPHISEMYHARFGDSLTGLVAKSLNQGIDLVRLNVFRENITFARNKIATKALENDCDYLLFIDDDMIFKSDLLERLLRHEKDIVGGLAFIRSEPHEPSFYTENSDGKTYTPVLLWKPNSLVKVDAIGMSATLIKKNVLEKMAENSEKHKGLYGIFEGYAEDFNFCRKAKKLGFGVYCDTSVIVGHLSEKIIGFGDYKAMAEEKFYNMKKYQHEKAYEEKPSREKSAQKP